MTGKIVIPAHILVRYCARELDSGVRCAHHLVAHAGEGPCRGKDPWGDPCGCQGFVAPAVEDRRVGKTSDGTRDHSGSNSPGVVRGEAGGGTRGTGTQGR